MAGSDNKEPKARRTKQPVVPEVADASSPVANPLSLKDRISMLLQNAETAFGEKTYKISVSDYIRLLQFQKELEDDSPVGVTATWVDPPTDTLNG